MLIIITCEAIVVDMLEHGVELSEIRGWERGFAG